MFPASLAAITEAGEIHRCLADVIRGFLMRLVHLWTWARWSSVNCVLSAFMHLLGPPTSDPITHVFTCIRFLIPLPDSWSLTPALLACFGLLVREATLMSVISVVRLLKGIRGEWLLPSEMCGWFATALSCCRGTVSNLTCLNPQTPTLTVSCDKIPFTGEMMNSVWVVGVLSFLARWFCFSVCSLLLILVC